MTPGYRQRQDQYQLSSAALHVKIFCFYKKVTSNFVTVTSKK